MNYRPSLWKSIGGQKRAQEVNREIAKYVDVMIGNEEDFTACLGFEVEGADEHLLHIDVTAFKKMIEKAVKAFPNFKVTATTLRAVEVRHAQRLGRDLLGGRKILRSAESRDLEILDRVGGGDSFASGLIYGLMKFNDPQKAVEYGAAHGALAMTTPGDTSMASLKEVEALVKGGSARVQPARLLFNPRGNRCRISTNALARKSAGRPFQPSSAWPSRICAGLCLGCRSNLRL